MRTLFFVSLLALCASAAPATPPLSAIGYQQRGAERFFAADIAGSIADFDAYLQARPEAAPYHWQRGIALYYAGRFGDGAAQFESHQTVNPNDVENAVWHFLCNARATSPGAARDALFPYTHDARVPMREIHALFAGSGSEKEVLAAAEAGSPPAQELRNRLCYAHLYLGLFAEISGDPETALSHIRQAATTYAMPHYMGKTAQVHLKLRTASTPE